MNEDIKTKLEEIKKSCNYTLTAVACREEMYVADFIRLVQQVTELADILSGIINTDK